MRITNNQDGGHFQYITDLSDTIWKRSSEINNDVEEWNENFKFDCVRPVESLWGGSAADPLDLDGFMTAGSYTLGGSFIYTDADGVTQELYCDFGMSFLVVSQAFHMVHQSITLNGRIISRRKDLDTDTWTVIYDGNYVKDKAVAIEVIPDDNGDDTCTVDLSDLGTASEIRCRTTISDDCSFTLPTPQTDATTNEYIEKEILLYAHFTDDVSVDWGNDVLFYGGEVPDIETGYYDLVFAFDPNAEAWCVGVLSKGDGA